MSKTTGVYKTIGTRLPAASQQLLAAVAVALVLFVQTSFAWHEHDNGVFFQPDCAVCIQLHNAEHAAISTPIPPDTVKSWPPLQSRTVSFYCRKPLVTASRDPPAACF